MPELNISNGLPVSSGITHIFGEALCRCHGVLTPQMRVVFVWLCCYCCWGLKSKVLLGWGPISRVDHSRFVVWLPGELGWAEGWNRKRVHGRRMGEDTASVFHDSQSVTCSGCSLGHSEAYRSTFFPQLLSLPCGSAQMYLFPITRSGINYGETRKFGE